MVNPNAGGDKGKGKMVMEDKKIDDNEGKGKMIKTCNNSKEEEEESKESPEWDDPLALQLGELLIHNLRCSFQTAIEKIAANGYSMEQAEWAVLRSSFYFGNDDITSNIVAASMAALAKKEEFDPSERYMFEGVKTFESATYLKANYALVEMVNALKRVVKPYLTVADAMWLLLLFDLDLLQAALWQYLDPKGSSSSFSTKEMFLQMEKNSRGETVYDDVPESEKDEAIAALMQRKKQVERELQGWSEWANVRVGQVAQKLMRRRKEEMKKISEMDLAIHNVEALKETANATLLRLQAEHTMLLKELEDNSKLVSPNNQNLQEIKLREQELLKQSTKFEAEIRSLQKDLARLKGESPKLQLQIDEVIRNREHEFEVLRQHLEREKIMLLQKAETLRRKRQEMEEKTKMEEDKLGAELEENRVKYEESMKKIRDEISAIQLGESSSSSSSGQRERECVMCLNQDKTVVFLPCAHQVVCEDCNELHERGGMKDCPTCRTPIMQRIPVRFQ